MVVLRGIPTINTKPGEPCKVSTRVCHRLVLDDIARPIWDFKDAEELLNALTCIIEGVFRRFQSILSALITRIFNRTPYSLWPGLYLLRYQPWKCHADGILSNWLLRTKQPSARLSRGRRLRGAP